MIKDVRRARPANSFNFLEDTNMSTLENKIIITQQQIDAAITTYNLQDLVKILPPQNYISHAQKTVRSTIEALCKDFVLTPYLKAIPKRPGAHPGKGLPSKRATIEALYGLNRHRTDCIEKLSKKWVRKAIKYAVKNERKIDVAFALRLMRENEQYYQKILATKAKEKRNAALAERMVSVVIADKSLPYSGAIIDLTQKNSSQSTSNLELPLADDALVFIAVYPKDGPKAYQLIDSLGLTFIDGVVWDRDVQVPTGDWTKNQHTNVLIAIKGNPKKPAIEFQLASIHLEHKTSEMTSIPDYYFDMMEQMFPGEQYLEVFSCRQFSDKWHIFETNI